MEVSKDKIQQRQAVTFRKSLFSSITKWLERQFLEFLGLLTMIRYHRRYSFQLIKTQALTLFTNSLIFPITKITLGVEKSHRVCQSFLKTHSPTSLVTIPLPPPLKSNITMRGIDFGLYSEIYLKNGYSQELLAEGMNIIDIGANVGVYTVLAAEKVGKNGRVVAVEPEPKNYKQLLGNIKLNNFQNVISKNIAMTNHEGTEKLYLFSSLASHSLIFPEDKNSYIEVPVKTIDKLLEELDIKKIDIIKIDAEGAEIPILKGAEKALRANPNMKMFIASYHYPSEVKEVRQFLDARGFKTKVSAGYVVITI